jgi:tetratricopeptide (TPR) repeat protein
MRRVRPWNAVMLVLGFFLLPYSLLPAPYSVFPTPGTEALLFFPDSWLPTPDSLPRLPKVAVANFLPEVRSQVQDAYDTATQHPQDAEASGKLAMLLDLYDRPDQASVCYQRAHQLDGTSFKWLYYLGSLQAKQGKRSEAATTLRAALRLNPDYLPARLKLAESLLLAGEIDASGAVYSEIVKKSSDVAEAYYGLGRIAVKRGDPTAAAGSFRKACALFPTYGAAHYALAQVEVKLGNIEESQKQLILFTKNKTIVPPVDDPLRDEMRKLDMAGRSHLERGFQLEQVGRVQDAIAETEQALRLDPSLVRAHINLIILYGRTGNLAKAEEHYQAVVKLNPNGFPEAHYDHGVLLAEGGKLDEAEKEYRRALEIDPTYADAHNNLGYLLERQGRLAEAATEYRKAIEAKPDSRQAHFNLGRILVNQQEYQEAIEQFQQTLTPVDANTPSYLYALGAAYGRAGDRANALRYLQEAKNQASQRGQQQLVADIERDLHTLGAAKQ